MSIHLQRELDKLKRDLLLICSIVEEQVQKAIRALFDRDAELAREVQAMDDDVDRREINLEEECLKTLALYQPVAINLRQLIAALKINNDLERIGDMAVNIARKATALAQETAVEIPADFADMGEQTQSMLRRSLDSLVQMDVALARDVCACDDEVDQLKKKTPQPDRATDPPGSGAGRQHVAAALRFPQPGTDRRLRGEHRRRRDLHGRWPDREASGRLTEDPMRKRRLFWQLYPATLLIAVLALAAVALDTSSSVRRFYLARTAEDLEVEGPPGRRPDRRAPGGQAIRPRSTPSAKELGQRSATRLTVILPDGKVVGDSLESPPQMDNHGTRPEVVDALDDGKGVSLRDSQTLHRETVLCGRPGPRPRANAGRGAGGRFLGGDRRRPGGDSQPHPRRQPLDGRAAGRHQPDHRPPRRQTPGGAQPSRRMVRPRRPWASAFRPPIPRKSAAWPRRSTRWPPTWKTSSTRSCGSGTSATPFSRAWWKASWPSTPTNACSA